MKQIIKDTPKPAYPTIMLDNALRIFETPHHRSNCDMIICYVTQGKLVATLEEIYDGQYHRYGFMYMQYGGSAFKFKQDSAREACEAAINNGRDLFVFENKYEFFQWIKDQPYYKDELKPIKGVESMTDPRIPKLRTSCFKGTDRCGNDHYGPNYYDVNEVNDYVRKVEELLQRT